MLSSRNWLLAASALLLFIFGLAIFIFTNQDQEPEQSFPATVNRDCAPWDGAAFTVMVQYDPATVIHVSIWRSPDLVFPSTFSFPDETGQIGNAYAFPELGPYTLLSGEASFQRVQQGTPLEGRFNLTSERGARFQGKFIAEWENQIVYCV